MHTQKLKLVVPRATSERLKTTCFRQVRGDAGRIAAYEDVEEVLEEPVIHEQFAKTVERERGDYSFTVSLPRVIGWESTIPYELARGLSVGRASLNRHAEALFVDDLDVPAPETSRVTIVYAVTRGVVFVQSIYPGRDVGELDGDVSDREKVVFFHWQAHGDDSQWWAKRMGR